MSEPVQEPGEPVLAQADTRPRRDGGRRHPDNPPVSARRVIVLWVAIGMVTAFALMGFVTVTGIGMSAPSAPGAGSATSPGASAELRAVGLITGIDASSPVDVRSFTLRTATGEVLTFEVVPGADTGFPAGHLQEHRASGEAVQVMYHVEGERNLVDRLDDAPAASPTA